MSEKQYIRVKKDGFIYEFNERLAANPACEIISEQEAYPERFITPDVAKRIAKPKRAPKAEKGLDLATDIFDEPVYTDPELAAEAARGWPE